MNQYAYQHPQPGHSYRPPAPGPQNGLGTAGFVLGLLGLLFSFIPVIGVIAWPLVLLGLVFAGVGLSRVRARRATNKGLTIAGVVCASAGLVMCVLYAAAFSAAVATAPTPPALAGPAPGITTADQSSGDTVPTVAAGIGDQVQDGSFAFTVTEVETGIESLGESFLRAEAQGMFVLVHVKVTNVGSEAQMFSGGNQTLLDAQGREFSSDVGAAVMNVEDSEQFLNEINPGNTVNGTVVFDVPEGLKLTSIVLRESLFSDGATVNLG